jgi:hypothetical protein
MVRWGVRPEFCDPQPPRGHSDMYGLLGVSVQSAGPIVVLLRV